MKSKKLDKRFSGFKDFKYCIDFQSAELNKFCEIRDWCWQQWGSSVELDTWYKIGNKNPSWVWQNDEWKTRIYLKSDSEYQWFILKWT